MKWERHRARQRCLFGLSLRWGGPLPLLNSALRLGPEKVHGVARGATLGAGELTFGTACPVKLEDEICVNIARLKSCAVCVETRVEPLSQKFGFSLTSDYSRMVCIR